MKADEDDDKQEAIGGGVQCPGVTKWTPCKGTYWGWHGDLAHTVCELEFGRPNLGHTGKIEDCGETGRDGGTWWTASYQCLVVEPSLCTQPTKKERAWTTCRTDYWGKDGEEVCEYEFGDISVPPKTVGYTGVNEDC